MKLAAHTFAMAAICFAATGAQAASGTEPRDGAHLVATVLNASEMPPARLARDIERDCSALEKNVDDPALACEAVRCATGVSPAWSLCPAKSVEKAEAH